MNKQNNMKGRQRGRSGGKQRPQGRNPNFDGGGNRPRGNAQQLMEKYLALARDATSSGDRVLAENYFQHADHYYRVLNARLEQQNGGRRHEGHGGYQDHRHQFDRQGNGERPFDSESQQGAGTFPGQQPQQLHSAAPELNAEQPQASDAEIALPPGILGEAPLEAANESPESANGGEEGAETGRARQGGRRRRGRGERSPANAESAE